MSQKLRLVCKACGQRRTYDVGRIWVWPPEDSTPGEPKRDDDGYAFSNYFHCRDCGSAGPWKVADYWKLLALTLLARASGGNEPGPLVFATLRLFDGTIVQSPAMGEAHLQRLLAKDPQSAFLHTRLGSLFRGCHRRSDAVAWYAKALALDAGDLEARYHLFCFAVDDADYPAAIQHGLSLVHHLLEGRTTKSDELTRYVALSVVEILREAPAEVRVQLLARSHAAAEAPEGRFVRNLLEQEGDEDHIVNDATERLLAGESAPETESAPMREPAMLATLVAESADERGAGPPIDLISSLRDVVQQEGLEARRLTVAVSTDGRGHIRVPDRHAVFLFDGKKGAIWQAPSLRELFRGDKKPPPDIEQYPDSYTRAFFCIERHVLTLCDAEGDRTDQEMEPVYSALRRRPDGKNHLGAIHDYLWQATALMLGLHRLSEAEFTAVVGQLERSVRKWALRPVSRNYAGYLRDHVG